MATRRPLTPEEIDAFWASVGGEPSKKPAKTPAKTSKTSAEGDGETGTEE